MPPRIAEAPPESDRFGDAPHPRVGESLIGHEGAEGVLLDAYRSERLAHAWILAGPEGIGKATLAWRFTRFLMINPDPRAPGVQAAKDLSTPRDHPAARRIAALSHGDVVLLRREWNEKNKRHFTEIRIEDVRSALGLFRRSSGEGGWRVCLIDSADDLNRSSANALLKMIEEPPPRSLFLLISHQPGLLLPTIRSRSRSLQLAPLTGEQVVEALRRSGEPAAQKSGQDFEEAARRARGSVREALRLLDGEGLRLLSQMEKLVGDLPRVDWRTVYAVADRVSTRDGEDSYRAFLNACYDWLDAQVCGARIPARMRPFADAWEKISGGMREVDALNLDRKAFAIGVFEDLAQAAQQAAAVAS